MGTNKLHRGQFGYRNYCNRNSYDRISPKEKGYIEFILILLLALVVLALWPIKFSNQSTSTNDTSTLANPCNQNSASQSANILAPPYPTKDNEDSEGADRVYKPVRLNVPVNIQFYNTDRHFIVKQPNRTINGKSYDVYYPNKPNGAGEIRWPQGIVSKYRHPGDKRDLLYFTDFHLIFLVQLKNGQPIIMTGPDDRNRQATFYLTDIYQDSGESNVLPTDAFGCKSSSSVDPSEDGNQSRIIFPNQGKSQDQKQLQLEYFVLDNASSSGAIISGGGWSPLCKPAIYLYPQQKQRVNVRVKTLGYLTYTDPIYPKETGWIATAYPDGKIETNQKTYPYLYYESKVEDKFIKKPDQGFVVKFDKLAETFDFLLPKLGLDPNQTKDFKDYWTKALAYSPYYFVGVMSQNEVDQIEPLEVSPKPDTVIRVRLYFQALDSQIQVSLPILITPQKSGFSLVEWGGLVKTDSLSPFTCSQ
ncbi:hypothetical protein HYS93_00945 [Candidatus Daviesbacteria bacterium]|nr:hypothetical protein [Candidatus Daviesbacteria bacterium]